MSEKLPPHDIDAEENVLGSLLIDGSAIYKIDVFLQADHFYSEQNALIYRACLNLYQRPESPEAIDQITVAQELARQGKLEACGGLAYLTHLISVVPTSLHIEDYAHIVSRLATMRRLISAGTQITALGYDANPDVDATLNKAEDLLFKLRHGLGPRDFVHVRQVLDEYLDTSLAPAGEVPTGRAARVLSGFTAVDNYLGSLNPSDLIIIAGRPSMGKSSLALGIARNVAIEQGACVAIFSLEMSRDALALRLISNEAGINSKQIEHVPMQNQSEENQRRLMEAVARLSESAIYLDDSPQLRIVEMRSKARRLHYDRGINLIIVDYLQLMEADLRGENRVQEISYITRSLKGLARELNVPVIAVSQLSRAAEIRTSHVPQLSDLRESGSIEQDADIVLFIYREEKYFTEEQWEHEHPDSPYPSEEADILIAKHRNGPTGQVKLRFQHRLAKFDNLITEEQPSIL